MRLADITKGLIIAREVKKNGALIFLDPAPQTSALPFYYMTAPKAKACGL